ncbi:MAG: sulfate ABC transporter permease subunit [Acidobacteriota bacterium]
MSQHWVTSAFMTSKKEIENSSLSQTQSLAAKKIPNSYECVLIGIVLIYAIGLLIGPLIAIAWGAFSKGITTFFQQITTADALSALKLTLILSFLATLINTIFGLSIGLVLARDKFRGQRIINGLIDLPFAVSPVIAGFMLILLFGRSGWFTSISDMLGIKVVFALPGMLLATTFVSLPFVSREVVSVLNQLGVEQEAAAHTMGASGWQSFWHITLPGIRWGLLSGISLSFARAIGEFGAVLVVSGGVKMLSETATLYIYRSLDDRNYVGAYAMSLVLVAISSSILVAIELIKKRVLRARNLD